MKDYEKPSNPTTLAKWLKSRQPKSTIRLRLAKSSDISELSKLYSICFGDKESDAIELLRFLLSEPDFQMLLATENEKIVSMLSLIPARLAGKDSSFLYGLYLYGIGTLPTYRKQGLSKSLIECVKEYAKSLSYDFLMLVPATTDLIPFYEKQGFTTKRPTNQSNKREDLFEFLSFSPTTIADYQHLRQNLEQKEGVLSLLEPFSSYALEMVADYIDISCFQKSLTHQIYFFNHEKLCNSTCFYFPLDDLFYLN